MHKNKSGLPLSLLSAAATFDAALQLERMGRDNRMSDAE